MSTISQLSRLTGLLILMVGAGPRLHSSPVQCVVTAETPLLRAEAMAELVGQIQIDCRGGDPNSVQFLNLELFLNVPITSDPTGIGTDELEALLLIDDPLPAQWNTSNRVLYFGQVKGVPGVAPGPAGGLGAPGSGNVYAAERVPGSPNRIRWSGIPFVPAPVGELRTLRIVNVRADLTSLDGSGPEPPTVRAWLATSGAGLLLVNSQVVLGYAVSSLQVRVEPNDQTTNVVLEERFRTAFRKRIENSPAGALSSVPQALPTRIYATESGFTPEFSGLEPDAIGVADTGTRFALRFSSLPEGCYLVVPARVTGETAEGVPSELELRLVIEPEEGLAGGTLSTEDTPEQLVVPRSGQAIVLYEVVARPPYAGLSGALLLDRFSIPVRVVRPQPVVLSALAVEVIYAPWHPSREPDRRAPEPRWSAMPPHGQVFSVPVLRWTDYVTFEYAPGDPAPLERTIEFGSLGGALTAAIEVVPTEARSWLRVVVPRAYEGQPVTSGLILRVDPRQLVPGHYVGALAVRLNDPARSLRVLPVLLTVLGTPLLRVDTAPIELQTVVGEPTPQPVIRLINSTVRSLPFSISARTEDGSSWLQVSSSWDWTPANLFVRVQPEGLAPGRYRGEIRIESERAPNSPLVVPVSLEVRPRGPWFDAAHVLHAATRRPGPLSPGQIVIIEGLQLGPDSPVVASLDASGRLPATLGGTTVWVDGWPAPLLAVAQSEITFVVPLHVAARPSAEIVVEFAGERSQPVLVAIAEVSPGLFSLDRTGIGQAAAVNSDGNVNSPANPARRGEVLALYMTGGGTYTESLDEFRLAPVEHLPRLVSPVRVRIGGVECPVEWAGAAPGQVVGLVQVNVRLSDGVPVGPAVPVELWVGTTAAPVTTYVSIEGS